MSYIRSPYNPEGLYIWSQVDGMCHFMIGPDMVGKIPTEVFNQLIDNYIENHDEYTEVGDARIEEVWIDVSGEKIPEDDVNPQKNELRMRLSYKDWHIDMWDVTWYYVARSNYGRSKPRWKWKLLRRFNII